MATVTPETGYLCCGSVAPESHTFDLDGIAFHVHRHVNEKGRVAGRFRNNWQLSHNGVPIGKLVAPSAQFVANTFEQLWRGVEAQKGKDRVMECFKEIYEGNASKISSQSTT